MIPPRIVAGSWRWVVQSSDSLVVQLHGRAAKTLSTDNPWQAPRCGPASSRQENGSATKPRTRGYVVIAVLALCSLIPPLTIVGIVCILCGVWIWYFRYGQALEARDQGLAPPPEPLGPIMAILAVPSAIAAGGAVLLGTCNVTMWGAWVPLSFLETSGPHDQLGTIILASIAGMIAGAIAGLIAAGYLLVRTNQRPLPAEQENETIAGRSNARIVMPMESGPVNPAQPNTSPGDPGESTG